MTRLSATEARRDLSNTLNKVAFGGTRIILHRRGTDVAALVSLEDLEILERLEDVMDIEAALKAEAQAAQKGEKPIPWEKVKAGLGL